MRRAARVLLVTVLGVTLVAPVVAGADLPRYRMGSGETAPFGGSLTNLERQDDGGLRLKRTASVPNLATLSNPRSVDRMRSGNLLVADGDGVAVREYRTDGTVAWYWDASKDPKLIRPFHAVEVWKDYKNTKLTSPHFLISDRTAHRVFEVDKATSKVVWEYGTAGKGVGENQLSDPFSATRTPSGTTLIADNIGGNRVIEVNGSKSVVWSYGTGGQPGTSAQKRLNRPRYAQRLDDGNTLITDADNAFVLEVDRARETKWFFGDEGTPGNDDTHIRGPCFARRLPDGRTLVVDTENDRLLWVNPNKSISDRYGSLGGSELDDPRGVAVAANGRMAVADEQNGRVVELGYETSGSWTSDGLNLGLPGVQKWFADWAMSRSTPTGTSAIVNYQLGGQEAFTRLKTSNFPTDTKGEFVRMRVDLASSDGYSTPILKKISIGYSTSKPKPATRADGSSKSSSKSDPPKSGTGSGSGSGATGSGVGSGGAIAATPTEITAGAATAGTGATGSGNGAGGTRAGAPGSKMTGSPSAGGIPGAAPGAGNSIIQGQVLENVGGPEPPAGKETWTTDPNADPRLLTDPVGSAIAATGVSAAFLTGIFYDGLGRAARAAVAAAITMVLGWRGA